MVSELDDILKNGYYESPVGYNRFVNEVMKIKNEMAFHS